VKQTANGLCSTVKAYGFGVNSEVVQKNPIYFFEASRPEMSWHAIIYLLARELFGFASEGRLVDIENYF